MCYFEKGVNEKDHPIWLWLINLPATFNIPKLQLQCYEESVYSVNNDILSICVNGGAPLERFTLVVAWTIYTLRPLMFDVALFKPILGETYHVSKGNLNVYLNSKKEAVQDMDSSYSNSIAGDFCILLFRSLISFGKPVFNECVMDWKDFDKWNPSTRGIDYFRGHSELHTDPEWRRLIELCWAPDSALRPSFTEITNQLRVMSVACQTKGHSHKAT